MRSALLAQYLQCGGVGNPNIPANSRGANTRNRIYFPGHVSIITWVSAKLRTESCIVNSGAFLFKAPTRILKTKPTKAKKRAQRKGNKPSQPVSWIPMVENKRQRKTCWVVYTRPHFRAKEQRYSYRVATAFLLPPFANLRTKHRDGSSQLHTLHHWCTINTRLSFSF